MRAGIVKSTTLSKYNRWDPEFYLHNSNALRARIKWTRIRLRRVIAAHRESLAACRESLERSKKRVGNGEVISLE